jgi:predicted MFS family arabinose efflux permease
MIDSLAFLWRQHSSRHLSLGIILLWTMGSGLAPWYAAFMVRSHGMGTEDLGVWMGAIFGIGGVAGILLGGYTAARWFSKNDRHQMRLIALATAMLFPCFVVFLLVPKKAHALVAMVPMVLVFNFAAGPIFALMQRLVVDEMRATALSVVMLLANLIGMGIGPQFVGILSDLLKPHLGDDSLRYAMLIMSLVALWSAYHFWRVGGTVQRDLEALPINKAAP